MVLSHAIHLRANSALNGVRPTFEKRYRFRNYCSDVTRRECFQSDPQLSAAIVSQMTVEPYGKACDGSRGVIAQFDRKPGPGF